MRIVINDETEILLLRLRAGLLEQGIKKSIVELVQDAVKVFVMPLPIEGEAARAIDKAFREHEAARTVIEPEDRGLQCNYCKDHFMHYEALQEHDCSALPPAPPVIAVQQSQPLPLAIHAAERELPEKIEDEPAQHPAPAPFILDDGPAVMPYDIARRPNNKGATRKPQVLGAISSDAALQEELEYQGGDDDGDYDEDGNPIDYGDDEQI